jgi:DNA-binding PadR family transcriptional regulator
MDFDANMTRSVIQPIVLTLVSQRPMYGYEIIKVVNERTQHQFAWKEGTLYPCLHRLESDGLIASSWQESPEGRRRKYYTVTRRGAVAARQGAEQWTRFAAAVNAVLLSQAGVPA